MIHVTWRGKAYMFADNAPLRLDGGVSLLRPRPDLGLPTWHADARLPGTWNFIEAQADSAQGALDALEATLPREPLTAGGVC